MNIAIIGSGNVATHLNRALRDRAAVSVINPRSLTGITQNADLIIIAVSDDAIEEVAAKIPETNALIAHTSGSKPMDCLKPFHKHIGVFYPWQTFSKDIKLNYEEIPVFIEASSSQGLQILENAANLFSNNVLTADSGKRRQLHLASVFACNFSNAMIAAGADILEKAGIPFSSMLPLLRQTINKLEFLSPAEAQTGPAVRGDKKVMEKHLQLLADNTRLAEIYRLISEEIENKKLQVITEKG